MPIPPNVIAAAQATQRAAAEDGSKAIRLVAGPGTGKSSAIEQRVRWLLAQGVVSARIFVISFTRASAKDLRERIKRWCEAQGQSGGSGVQVSTLHSLALRTLRRAGLLARYPVDPLVLDDWEVANIHDPEFGVTSGIASKRRRSQIRYFHEAFWSTGVTSPPNYLPPRPPISKDESNKFRGFHRPTSQVYSCVLPGEIVRQCVREIKAGNIDPVELLQIEHLIVDEFQDLNPMDLDFVDGVVTRGAIVFVAGDDDQSIYSFRFADPSGLQTFPARHGSTKSHALDECFRCMPEILSAAGQLMTNFALPHRIHKNLASLYRHCAPASNGYVYHWRFSNGAVEARAIAESCAALIQAGLNPATILILLNHQPALAASVTAELTAMNVPFDAGQADHFANGPAGRLGFAILRIIGNSDDYVAHRTVMGLHDGVGVSTTNRIRELVIQKNLNYKDLFYHPLPAGVFTGRLLRVLNDARSVCQKIIQWNEDDVFSSRSPDLRIIIEQALGADEAALWQQFTDNLPQAMLLKELRDLLAAPTDEQRANILSLIYERLGEQMPEADVVPPRVKVMTMHGAKGLAASVVFIPGLEDELLPGPKRAPYPGLVWEAARLLYVSITRARATCILSYVTRRFMNGRTQAHTSSRFNAHLGGIFAQRAQGLNGADVQQIAAECLTI